MLFIWINFKVDIFFKYAFSSDYCLEHKSPGQSCDVRQHLGRRKTGVLGQTIEFHSLFYGNGDSG
jgi:hypothetical protein